MGLQCAASSARVQSGDIGAVGGTDCAADSDTYKCAYSCAKPAADGCADCSTNTPADIGADYHAIVEAHRCPY